MNKPISFKLSNQNRIYFLSFPSKIKDIVIDLVIKLAQKKNVLPKLSKNYSYEGGFTLPLTTDWIYTLKRNDYSSEQLLKYHSSRDFRFVESLSYINCLRVKDNLNYWTKEESDILKQL